MCYSDDSRPPLPPAVGGAAADHGEVTLTSADGTRLMAYAARAQRPTGAGMVICPDVRGLHHFYEELAQRFAEAGLDAVAFDYFGRTAESPDRDESFEYRPHVERTRPATVDQDARAAMDYLRTAEGGAVSKVFTVGFCFGGDTSWRQAANGSDGSIGFYGVPARFKNAVPDLHAVKAPLLLLVAGADFTPQEEFQKFDRELADAGVEHRLVVYPDAPHSFFDRSFEQWREYCDDAWRQMLDFVKENSGPAV